MWPTPHQFGVFSVNSMFLSIPPVYRRTLVLMRVGFYPQEDLWKLSSDKREVFFLFIV